jgi:integrase
MKLTSNRIRTLACAPGKRDQLVFDDEQRGLAVRVTATGGKSYLAQYSFQGRKRRVPLGSCSAIPLAEARVAARAVMGDVARAAERKRAASEARTRSFTLAALIDDWRVLHLATRRPRYAVDAVRTLRRVFARDLETPACDLDRMAVVKALDAMTRRGRATMAAQTVAYGKACYGWALKRGSIAANPFTNMPVAPAVKRERVLTDHELSAIWKATVAPGPFNGIVRILILTGARCNEVAGMRWAELSGDVWTIPAGRTKNKRVHIVPLSAQAQGLLCDLPRLNEWVFPGLRGPFKGFARAKAAIDCRSGVTGWRLHDLRRTVATGLQRLGVRLEVTEAVLGHAGGSRAGIVGVYQRHDYAAEQRDAIDAWGEHIESITE